MKSVEACAARIARRVAEGGHDVPAADLLRRFARGASHFRVFVDVVDLWRIMDNNGPKPVTAAEGRAGCVAVAGGLDGLPPELAALVAALPPCDEAGSRNPPAEKA